MIFEQLEALRAEFSECLSVVLADISSGTVLCVSAAEKHPQERQDSLCELAAEMLDGAAANSFSQALNMPESSAVNESVVLAGSETYLFLRSAQDPVEAMLCICSNNIDLESFIHTARAQLNCIAQE